MWQRYSVRDKINAVRALSINKIQVNGHCFIVIQVISFQRKSPAILSAGGKCDPIPRIYTSVSVKLLLLSIDPFAGPIKRIINAELFTGACGRPRKNAPIFKSVDVEIA